MQQRICFENNYEGVLYMSVCVCEEEPEEILFDFKGCSERGPIIFMEQLDIGTSLDKPRLLSTAQCACQTCQGSSNGNSSGDAPCPAWPRPYASDEDLLEYRKRSGFQSRSSRSRRLFFNSFQVLSLLVCILGAYTLVISIASLKERGNSKNFTHVNIEPIRDQLKSWVLASRSGGSQEHQPGGSLLDIPDFYFLLNNVSICITNRSDSPSYYRGTFQPSFPSSPTTASAGKGVYFMIIVHSAPDHFVERQAIRDTWGSVKSIKSWAIRLVFLLGSGQESDSTVRKSIFRESAVFGDIVSGNFYDTYRNLTYKHLMGYQWALNFCPGATFVLKTDDDAFIDIFQLFELTTRTYGFNPADTLVCNVFPEGTKPIRPSDPEASEAGRKWVVTREEYPFDSYPKYCGGLAYLISPDVLERILRESVEARRFFWIDDVYVTGVLRELIGKEPFYLNLRYSYEPEEYRKWLEGSRKGKKIPFMIVHVERGPSFTQEMSHMWMKTVNAWSASMTTPS